MEQKRAKALSKEGRLFLSESHSLAHIFEILPVEKVKWVATTQIEA